MPEPTNNMDATGGRDVRATQPYDAPDRVPSPGEIAVGLDARLEMLGVPPREQLGPRARQAFDGLVSHLSAEAASGRSMSDAAIARALSEVATLARHEAVLEGSPSASGPQIVDPRTFDLRPSGPDSMMLAGAYPPALKELLRGLGIDPKRVSPEMAQAIVEMASRRAGCDLQDPECWRALAEQLIGAMPADRKQESAPNRLHPTSPSQPDTIDEVSSMGSHPSARHGSSPPARPVSPVTFAGREALGVDVPRPSSNDEVRSVMAMSRRHDPDANIAEVMTPIFQEAGLNARGAQRHALSRLRDLVRSARRADSGAPRTPAAIQIRLIKDLLTASSASSPSSSSSSSSSAAAPASSSAGSPTLSASSQIEMLAPLLDRLEAASEGSVTSPVPDSLALLAGRAIADAIMPGRSLSDASLRRLAHLATGLVLGRPVPSHSSASAGLMLPPEIATSLAAGRIDEASERLFAKALDGSSAKKGIESRKLDPELVQRKAVDAFSQILSTKPKDRISLASSALDWLKASGVAPGDLTPEEVSLAQIRDHLPELDAEIAALDGSLRQQDVELARLGERTGMTLRRIESAKATNDPALESLQDKLSALEQAGRSAVHERGALADGLAASKQARDDMTSALDRLLGHVLGKVVDHGVSAKALHEASVQAAGPYVEGLSRLFNEDRASTAAASATNAGATNAGAVRGQDVQRRGREQAPLSVSANDDRGAGGTSAVPGSDPSSSRVPGLPEPKETLAQERVRVCNAILRDPSLSMVDKILLFVLTYAAYAGAEHDRYLRELAEIDKKEADWEALHRQLSTRSDALEKQRDAAADALNRARSAYEDAARANGGHEGSPAVDEARHRVEAQEKKLAAIDKLRVEVNQKEQEVLQNKPKEPRDLILTKMQRISQLREMMLKMGNDFLEEEKRLLERINRF
ncbi:MAG: hypothetical protein IPK13_04755 [Deltaproteobacteria bacterium]|nr:hypothetical protein [Deltaproteobacteria bacterium]